MKKEIVSLMGILLFLCFSEVYAQKKPMQVQCPVNSVTPDELDAGSGAGQVYPSISVSTLNNCTNYTINNSYAWMSYVKNGLTVSVSVTQNTDWHPRSGCLGVGDKCVFVFQGCSVQPDAAGSITGSASVCQGQTGVTYSVPTITHATGYAWSLPEGATITSGNNTNQITVSFSTSASSGNITVHGTNSCYNGNGTNSPNFAVAVSPLPTHPLTVTSSRTSVCHDGGGNITLHYTGGTGTTFRWLTGGCTNGAPVGTGQDCVVSAPNSTTVYYGRWETSCGNSTCASVTITCYPTPFVSISQQPNPALVNADWITLRSSVIYGGDGTPTYLWTGPNFTSYDQDASVGVYHDNDPLGPYYLAYTSAQGCISNTPSWLLHITSGKMMNATDSNSTIESGFTLYPNPASDNVTVTISETSSLSITDQRYIVKVYNSLGTIMGSYTMLGNTFNIPVNSLQEGNYTVIVNNGNISATNQLIIKRN